MNRETFPIASILVKDRQRQDLGDIDSLAVSLRSYGLIQPIVLDGDNRLIAGGRRLAAATSLGWTNIDIVRRATLNEDELQTLELEENLRRKDISWQEQCIAIAKIHRLKVLENLGRDWGQKMTGEMLGLSAGNVNYCIRIAEWLRDPSHPAWQCDGINDAWRKCWLRPQEDAALAELARRTLETTNYDDTPPGNSLPSATTSLPVGQEPSVELESARERYLANPHNDSEKFEKYWAEKVAEATSRANTIAITQRFVHGNCITWMNEHPAAVDHIITDIPYGIDMDNIDQENLGSDAIDLVREEHDVEENMSLMKNFFSSAFDCVRDKGFLATCCDLDQWHYMKEWAENYGWRVQRWPVIWLKTNPCSNKAAAFNTTKDFEVVMICSKPGATIAANPNTSIVTADNREAVASTGHPFAKPFELTKFLLDALTIPKQTVLDPFAGRGSIILSMINEQRNWIAVEKNVAHFNSLVENVKQKYLSINPNFRFE